MVTEKNFNNVLSKHTNSSMFSDILSELGVESTVIGFTLNLPAKRFFGKVSTLRIRRLKKGEDPNGIYEALKSYSQIDDGDVIVVDTEVPDRAYFGELNANLALRSGAVGTIVNGFTRDIENVNTLDYPVLSKGYCAADVKNYGTLDFINEPITISGITVNPGDYVFADINGAVFIPKEMKDKVIDAAVRSIEKEMDVKRNIIMNVEAFDITKKTGAF